MRSGRTPDSTVSSATRSRSHVPPTAAAPGPRPCASAPHNETQAFTPAIRVDADGNIGVTYYDFRNDKSATTALDTDAWFTRSADGGRTWSEERRDADIV